MLVSLWTISINHVIYCDLFNSLHHLNSILHKELMILMLLLTSSTLQRSLYTLPLWITYQLLFILKTKSNFYWALVSYWSYLYRYWPVIDDALRTAAYERGVHVRLMGSYWEQTRVDMLKFLHSLGSLNITGPYNGSIETV